MSTGIFPACVGRNDGGPETYELNLVQSIAKLDSSNAYHIFCFSQKAIDRFKEMPNNIIFHKLWPNNRLISLSASLPISVLRSGVDLYHSTFIPGPLVPTPSVFTMHDVSPLTHPHFYPTAIRNRLLPMIKNGLKNAKVVICISEDCRQTTAKHFGVPLEKMVVVHHGVNPNFQPVDRVKAEQLVSQFYGINDEYILYLGKIEARKNIIRIIESYAKLKKNTSCKAKLVLAGRRFWDLENIDQRIADLGLKNDIIEPGYIADEHLPALYSASQMFLFPSLWEGFGFPVLEAFACGTPVITSNISCLPEIAGGAARLVNPHSIDEIADAMADILENEPLRAQMKEHAYAQVKKFSWEKTAKQTLSAYTLARKL